MYVSRVKTELGEGEAAPAAELDEVFDREDGDAQHGRMTRACLKVNACGEARLSATRMVTLV